MDALSATAAPGAKDLQDPPRSGSSIGSLNGHRGV